MDVVGDLLESKKHPNSILIMTATTAENPGTLSNSMATDLQTKPDLDAHQHNSHIEHQTNTEKQVKSDLRDLEMVMQVFDDQPTLHKLLKNQQLVIFVMSSITHTHRENNHF